ncbi:MAG: hypothetical protein RDU20_09865 [Desulfomonilaceae bacterium]|nr:hypothetical protein [Desulfomonilaceae bacterium]
MKLTNLMQKALPACLILAVVFSALTAYPSEARALSSWWGGSSWWDWSDFRGSAAYRISLPSISGTFEVSGETDDFSKFGFGDDPDLFNSVNLEFYIDRLGFRVEVEEDHRFTGRLESLAGESRISELDLRGIRLGLDLDVIRTPFARAGIDFTGYLHEIKFTDRRGESSAWTWTHYSGKEPLQLGVHARIFPGRIRDVPITIQGRFRFPVPFLDRPTEAKITDWEISAGLRPAIWETSLLGHSTFSFGIEGGYRMSYLMFSSTPLPIHADEGQQPNIDGAEANVTARWGGAFIQAVVSY